MNIVTGVTHQNRCNFDVLCEEEQIDLTYIEFQRQYKEKTIDDLKVLLKDLELCTDADEISEAIQEFAEEHKTNNDDIGLEIAQGDLLIGSWKINEKGEYEPDENGEYAALWRGESGYIQVVWSKYHKQCHKCSPCFPLQGDLDTPGDDYTAYTLPPEFWNVE